MGNVIAFGQARQAYRPVTDGERVEFRPFMVASQRRVALPPPMRDRIMRKFYELGHSVRRIARAERINEAVIEQCAREKYWNDHKDNGSGSGPVPAAALRVARMSSVEADAAMRRRVA